MENEVNDSGEPPLKKSKIDDLEIIPDPSDSSKITEDKECIENKTDNKIISEKLVENLDVIEVLDQNEEISENINNELKLSSDEKESSQTSKDIKIDDVESDIPKNIEPEEQLQELDDPVEIQDENLEKSPETADIVENECSELDSIEQKEIENRKETIISIEAEKNDLENEKEIPSIENENALDEKDDKENSVEIKESTNEENEVDVCDFNEKSNDVKSENENQEDISSFTDVSDSFEFNNIKNDISVNLSDSLPDDPNIYEPINLDSFEPFFNEDDDYKSEDDNPLIIDEGMTSEMDGDKSQDSKTIQSQFKILEVKSLAPNEFVLPEEENKPSTSSSINLNEAPSKIKIVPLSKLTDNSITKTSTSLLVNRIKSITNEKLANDLIKEQQPIASTSTTPMITVRSGSSRRKSQITPRIADDTDEIFESIEEPLNIGNLGEPDHELVRNVAFLRVCVNQILAKIGKRQISFGRINPKLADLINIYMKC